MAHGFDTGFSAGFDVDPAGVVTGVGASAGSTTAVGTGGSTVAQPGSSAGIATVRGTGSAQLPPPVPPGEHPDDQEFLAALFDNAAVTAGVTTPRPEFQALLVSDINKIVTIDDSFEKTVGG